MQKQDERNKSTWFHPSSTWPQKWLLLNEVYVYYVNIKTNSRHARGIRINTIQKKATSGNASFSIYQIPHTSNNCFICRTKKSVLVQNMFVTSTSITFRICIYCLELSSHYNTKQWANNNVLETDMGGLPVKVSLRQFFVFLKQPAFF